jgi:SAM-dependent methyltransferase
MMITPQSVAAWSDPSIKPLMNADEAIAAFHALSAKVRFIKTLPVNASLLDAGAGSTILFRDWLEPVRRDLRMFAWAGERGEFFVRFEVAEVGLWPNDPPRFGGQQFDAVMSVNFIEHIDDPLFFVRFCAERLAPRGRIYLEWPRAESINLPSTAELETADVPFSRGLRKCRLSTSK